MLGRRDFLAKSLGAGVVLATASLTDSSKAFAAGGSTGYGIGQALPPIVGLDQYNAPQRLANLRRSWVLLDLCPLWCTACQNSATQHAAFRQYVRASGIPFQIFSIAVEAAKQGVASQRNDAEQWAETFQLCNDIVLHCNGDATSPLRNLVYEFAAANGQSNPSYPNYALIDPEGVVRYYQDFADLNELQAQLSALTGIALTQTWTLESPVPRSGGYTTITVNGQFSDGSPLNETISRDVQPTGLQGIPSADVAIGLFGAAFPLSGFTNAIVCTTAREFDPNTPIELVFTQTSPQVAANYTRVANVGDTFAFAPDAAFSGSDPGPYSVDTNQLGLSTDAAVSRGASGVTFDLGSIADGYNPQLPAGQTWSVIWFSQTLSSARWAMAYSLTETLIADITASTIAAPSKVLMRLEKILRSLHKRRFSSAAGQAQVALNELGAAAADLAIQADAAWLVSHLTNLASQT